MSGPGRIAIIGGNGNPSERRTATGKYLMYAILECPDGPALCVGYRTLASAVAALGRLQTGDIRYSTHVVEATGDGMSSAG
jgi:hypothetical protein